MSSCLSHTVSVLAAWPHLASPTTMAYCALRVERMQYLVALHRNHIHVRHVNMEADVVVYSIIYHVSMPLTMHHKS